MHLTPSQRDRSHGVTVPIGSRLNRPGSVYFVYGLWPSVCQLVVDPAATYDNPTVAPDKHYSKVLSTIHRNRYLNAQQSVISGHLATCIVSEAGTYLSWISMPPKCFAEPTESNSNRKRRGALKLDSPHDHPSPRRRAPGDGINCGDIQRHMELQILTGVCTS